MRLDIDKLNFERCEDEPIHIPETIQEYGYLFAIDPDSGMIRVYSENVKNLFKDHDLYKKNFFEILQNGDQNGDQNNDQVLLLETRKRALKQNTALPIRVTLKKKMLKNEGSGDYYAMVYNSRDHLVIELEPAAKFRQEYSARHYGKLYAMSLAPKFKSYKSLEEMSQEIVDTIKLITGYDRVILYKFLEDASGHVLAEAKEANMDSYLNLRYPAHDIPEQARELYKKNWIRLTPDVDLEDSRLLPEMKDVGRRPLDLTHSVLRSLSPIHRQYVRNQGLKSSLSMSLVTHDKLWGLISCHHREARYIPQNVRLECENLSQLFSWNLYAKEEELYNNKRDKTDRAINSILSQASFKNPIIDVFQQNSTEVLEAMECDGFMFVSELETLTIGEAPDASLVKQVFTEMKKSSKNTLMTSNADKDFEHLEGLKDIKGVLLLRMVESRDYFTAWFRKEERLVQKWVGAPDEKDEAASKKERLSPRTSFEVHERVFEGKSRRWTNDDADLAERFQRVFLGHVLQTQDKMRRQVDRLEAKDLVKNDFLITLAHELKNPLSPIVAGVELLENESNSEVPEEIFRNIKKQLTHMNTMIDDLMDVGRVAHGKVALNIDLVNLQAVLNDAEVATRKIFEEKKHRLRLELPEEPVNVRGDAVRLTQVFSNLLNNAAKYTEPGGRITVLMRKKTKEVSVKVQDNGIGIPMDKLEEIFSIFTQMDADHLDPQGGLGIGLALVKRLVEMHGGQVLGRSEGPGNGSEFEVLLPLAADEQGEPGEF